MRFSAQVGLSKFFQAHHYIELNDLLSCKEVENLGTLIDKALEKRLGLSPDKLASLSFSDLFNAGRDLSRTNDEIKEFVCNKKFGEILYEITGVKPIRFAYDQVFRFGHLDQDQPPLFSKPETLATISSLQGDLFGLMLTIKGGVETETPLFSKKTGNGVLFSSQHSLSFAPLYKHSDQCYLLVVFTSQIAVVIFNEKISHPFAFKQIGYAPGDTLRDDLNPILFR
ncbi:MAG: hypothetical protein KDK55_06090 [Chlamydiia bacterium]|nr:hypothetical protein [Chlamydiia bacterium]